MATTPPPSNVAGTSQQLANFETPPGGKQGLDCDAQNGDLETKRFATLSDVGPTVPEIKIKKFFEKVMPKLPESIEANIETITDRVLHGNTDPANPQYTWSAQYVQGRWCALFGNPQYSAENENRTFKPLEAFSTVLQRAVALVTENTHGVCDFSAEPDSVPVSEWQRNQTRPDGHFLRRLRTFVHAHWMDIAATGECKKGVSAADRDDDILKVLWNMHHQLREDPCCRFTFAFTIEATNMRLWYSSRSEILVSEPFDINTHPRYLIRSFLSFMYASTTSLGWDPTMTCHLPTNPKEMPSYSIQVQSKDGRTRVYRTVNSIASIGVDAIRGRGTRVWQVYDEEDPKTRMVLKDAWIDSDRQREGDILAEMRKAAQTDEQRTVLANNFLTVVAYGDVLIDGRPDMTLSEETRQSISAGCKRLPLMLAEVEKFNIRGRQDCMSYTPSGSHHSDKEVRNRLFRHRQSTYRTKTHHRSVFKEVCTPLHEETSLKQVLLVLLAVCCILQVMHQVGYVHRDVSVGNILIFDKDGQYRVILADLEYAKKIGSGDPTPRQDVRTGTPDFMAVEVTAAEHVFGYTGYNAEDDAAIRNFFGSMARGNMAPAPSVDHRTRGPSQLEAEVTFVFIPLHDLESVWWIAVYFIFYKKIKCSPRPDGRGLPPDLVEDENESAKRVIAQAKFGEGLFYYRDQRMHVFCNQGPLQRAIKHLHPAVRAMGTQLEMARRMFVDKYRRIEQSGQPLSSIVVDLHSQLGLWINPPKDDPIQLNLIVVEPLPAPRPLATGSVPQKRSRSGTGESSSGSSQDAQSPTLLRREESLQSEDFDALQLASAVRQPAAPRSRANKAVSSPSAKRARSSYESLAQTIRGEAEQDEGESSSGSELSYIDDD